MQRDKLDIIVIGSGPGGEGAAMQASKAGKSVVVVERYDQVGGGCTHWGTIPSKTLRHAIQELTSFRRHPLYQQAARAIRIDFPDLLQSAASVIARQVDMRQGFYERNRVEVIQGHARFVDEHALEVELPSGRVDRLEAEHVVIATGSRPYQPATVDFAHPTIFDADTILRLDRTPQSLLIYGAGVIGCEYASMFRNLGMKVSLVNTRDTLLTHLDEEIVDALAYHLRDQGVLIRNREEYDEVVAIDDRTVELRLRSGKRLRGDALLWAIGRTGNSDGMGLSSLGLQADSRGNLSVSSDSYQTDLPHIYAVGDIAGPPALASTAYDQGRLAAQHIVHGKCDHALGQCMPTGIYTSPEISSVGRTERELTEARIPYEVGHSQFKWLARAQITNQTVGMLKLLFHRETLEVLGIHCFGYQAAEIIHIGQAIIAQGPGSNTIEYFANTTFNYPTMAEAYRVAALMGLNRVR
ncbi:MAG: Si-specific NAD(P)(+) transhydrogenase [Deltaproteobacteria bacterium]|nr:Si-specific NAD(P)(+) transhydrogenase [Deltaproteobacteria bacterium]